MRVGTVQIFSFWKLKLSGYQKRKGKKKKKKKAVFYVNYYNVDGGSNFLRVNLAIENKTFSVSLNGPKTC